MIEDESIKLTEFHPKMTNITWTCQKFLVLVLINIMIDTFTVVNI